MSRVPPPPLSLYIHLPWCIRKCPYCDFVSYKAGSDPPKARYIEALLQDLEAEAECVTGRTLISIFLGGGTPSLFLPAEIAAVLDGVQRHFALADDVEVTMEANPGTVECGDPLGYRQAGINRLSIGAQSFSLKSLALLGRIHTVADIARAFGRARRAGFTNINLDVMYALPEQRIADAVDDLRQAAALEPEHVSWYQLTIEPNTQFHVRPPAGLPDEELAYAMQCEGQNFLSGRGYEQYEVSAYARDGRRCRHNLNYWSFGDYVAVGAGAHGKLSGDQGIRRYAKPAHPHAYIAAIESGACRDEGVAIEGPDRVFEFMLNALRLTEGFSSSLFERRTGLSADFLEVGRRRLQAKRLIDVDDHGIWHVTEVGRRFLDDLQAEFLP